MASICPARSRMAARWPRSSGPGSITRVGPAPTIHVLVPSRVKGPGLGATTPCTGRSFTPPSCQRPGSLPRPDPFVVVEVGAGDGTLAGQILGSLPSASRSATRYIAVERGEAARDSLITAGIEALPGLSQVAPGQTGCVLANELIDNVPFHR